ncbi:MAG: N-acetyl-gamma-glutamyl-phosphate reductase, partial [Candidatus Gracilibacteria bacterium]|nr:N-acetyl-gamma-glutamyl-phosphate reductase [Candidatus Gracilibacteria bacterium]
PEIKNIKKKIEGSELVSNPGCHATAVILSIKPLTEDALIKMHSAVITSITGYSGGGKEMIAHYQQDPQQPSYQYSTGTQHKHVGEIKKQTGLKDFIFQPEVIAYFNGLKTNTFLQLTQKGKKLSQEDFINLFKKYYEGKRFIKVFEIPDNGKIYMNENNDSQNTSIYIKKYPDTLQIIAVIDNMMKGAAGSVIQNMNIMLGLDEEMGL